MIDFSRLARPVENYLNQVFTFKIDHAVFLVIVLNGKN